MIEDPSQPGLPDRAVELTVFAVMLAGSVAVIRWQRADGTAAGDAALAFAFISGVVAQVIAVAIGVKRGTLFRSSLKDRAMRIQRRGRRHRVVIGAACGGVIGIVLNHSNVARSIFLAAGAGAILVWLPVTYYDRNVALPRLMARETNETP